MSWLVTGVLFPVFIVVSCGSRASLQPPAPAGRSEPVVSSPARDAAHLTPGQALMQEALRGMRSGRAAEMRPLWRRALVEYPAMGDYHLYYLGLAEASAGDREAAMAAFETLLRDEPDSVLRSRAALQLGGLLMATDADAAADRLRIARQHSSAGDPEWVKASLLLARLEAESGEAARAQELLDEVRSQVGPGIARQRARRATRELVADHVARTPDQALKEARLLLREGDAPEAEEVLRAALSRSPGRAVRPGLLSALAEAQHDQDKTAAAERSLQEVLDRYPNDALAPTSLMMLARWRWNRDDDGVALRRFRLFVKRYPRHSRAPEAWLAIARIHQAAGRFDEARASYREITRRFPRSEEARDARWRMAWLTYLHGDRSAARDAFARLASRSREAADRERAAYWHARATAQVSGASAAEPLFRDLIAEYPDGYYAIWAERALEDAGSTGQRAASSGESQATVVPVAATDGGAPPFPRSLAVLSRQPGADALDGARLGRAVELDAMGLRRHAARELGAIPFPPGSRPDAQLVLLEAYDYVGDYRRALRLSVLRRPTETPIGEHPMDRFAYPRGYWELLTEYGRANRLDPMLVAAVIRQESAFDPAAVSPVGARGLMQLMPPTAARVAAALGRPAPSASDLEYPAVNIQLGTRYLGQLMRLYNGDMHRAVAAYNAGEDAVAKWDRRFGQSAPDEFVEQITYSETRGYVKSVLRGQRRYRSLYDAGRGAPGSVDEAMAAEVVDGAASVSEAPVLEPATIPVPHRERRKKRRRSSPLGRSR